MNPVVQLRRAAGGVSVGSSDVTAALRCLLLDAAEDYEAVEYHNANSDAKFQRTGYDQTYVVHASWVGHAVAIARAVLADEEAL